MTLADEIRSMDDKELARFLVLWGVPDECEDCKYFGSGCAYQYSYERRVELMLEIITRVDN